MDREHKVWGERWIVRRDSTHETALLSLKANHRCSWHRHQTKWNQFVVLIGKVSIITSEGETRLTEGQSFTVRPGIWHEFRVHEASWMIEEMFVEYDPADIERENTGGQWKPGSIDETRMWTGAVQTRIPVYEEL